MSYVCEVCGKSFANSSNLIRHMKMVHRSSTKQIRQAVPLVNGSTVMQHPFTCIVAGCTQSGKTVWVKTLLENARTTINPPPERIIWCYGQWQPMYLEMIKTIPGIELNEGIPTDIDAEDFLDVSKRNLIVLDDLMDESGGDKRIASLFTRGSHHRNLSVIYIVQNIFHQGKETRNISLNAHYIVLFKSPRDKQQISVLARQVNPGHAQEFMKSYEKATSRPHGYLMLDLKPTTDDQHRLKTNVLPEENSSAMQQNLNEYIQKQSYQQPPIVNAMYNTKQLMRDIEQSPQLTPDEKNILHSNQLERFLAFQQQLQNQQHQVQSNLQTQLLKVIQTLTETPQKPQQSEPQQPKHLPLNPPSGLSVPKPYFLTPPPTVEYPKPKLLQKWLTVNSDTDESDTGENESDSEDAYGEDPYEREDYNSQNEDSLYSTMYPENELQNPYKMRTPRYDLRNRPY